MHTSNLDPALPILNVGHLDVFFVFCSFLQCGSCGKQHMQNDSSSSCCFFSQDDSSICEHAKKNSPLRPTEVETPPDTYLIKKTVFSLHL